MLKREAMMIAALRTLMMGFAIVFWTMFVASAQTSNLSEEQEARAQKLFGELRCVVCQNQSIADSDADVARDLRQLVREEIASGASNGDVKKFLIARYGEFVLLKPSFAPHTVLLWLSPLLFLLFGIYWIFRSNTTRRSVTPPLNEEEKNALEDIRSK